MNQHFYLYSKIWLLLPSYLGLPAFVVSPSRQVVKSFSFSIWTVSLSSDLLLKLGRKAGSQGGSRELWGLGEHSHLTGTVVRKMFKANLFSWSTSLASLKVLLPAHHSCNSLGGCLVSPSADHSQYPLIFSSWTNTLLSLWISGCPLGRIPSLFFFFFFKGKYHSLF